MGFIADVLKRIFRPRAMDLAEVFGTESLSAARAFYEGKEAYFTAELVDTSGHVETVTFYPSPIDDRSHWIIAYFEEKEGTVIAIRKADKKVLSSYGFEGEERLDEVVADSFASFLRQRLVKADAAPPPAPKQP